MVAENTPDIVQDIKEICKNNGWNEKDEILLMNAIKLFNGYSVEKTKRITIEINRVVSNYSNITFPGLLESH